MRMKCVHCISINTRKKKKEKKKSVSTFLFLGSNFFCPVGAGVGTAVEEETREDTVMAPDMSFNVTPNSYCLTLPPKMGSRGVWISGYMDGNVMQYGLPQFFLQFVVMFIFTKVLNYLLRPIGMTKFVSQFLAGILLGPSCIGRNEVIMEILFPKFNHRKSHAEEVLNAQALFGYSFFLFIVAVKMDMGLLFRVGKKAWVIGVANVLLPMFMAAAALVFFQPSNANANHHWEQLTAITVEQCITSFPVISWLLQDMNLLNTELGRLALSSSVISNITSIVIVVLVMSLSYTDPTMFTSVILTVAFIVIVVFVIRPGMLWVVRNTAEGEQVKDIYLNILLMLVFLSGIATSMIGQFVYLGPFILGLAVPEGPPLGSAIVGKIENFFQGILLPIYVTSTVANVDFNTPFNGQLGEIRIDIMLILIVFAAKMVACLAPALCCKVPLKDSLVLALIMSCRGVVDVANYEFLYDTQQLSEKRYALMMMAIFISAACTPFSVNRLFSSSRKYVGYQRRNLIYLKPDAELPVLACIHRSDNISSSINLIDSFNPTHESPIKIYALHLLKLIGQSTSVFISHQKDRAADGKSKSESVILAFTNYMHRKAGSVQLNLFTAMSPPKMMPENVCHLALDKLVSLILLPFHKRWSNDGWVEQEDANLQTLNTMVLERAPCSVGILIDRGFLSQSPAYRRSAQALLSVGVFFLGGNDDREAVTLAKRMARDPTLELTVIHLCVRQEEGGVISWEKMMDDEILDDIKHGQLGNNAQYVKEYVEDGPQTALLVRSMADRFNLIIVGRHQGVESTQTSGLREWVELPELGVLGDILASGDITSRTSILVIQQQKLNAT